MLVIHPLLSSDYAKCTFCNTIHIINWINRDTPNINQNCHECKNPDVVLIDIFLVPVIIDSKMPKIDFLMHL